MTSKDAIGPFECSKIPFRDEATFEINGCSLRVLDIRTLVASDFKHVAQILPTRNVRAGKFYHLEDRLRCIGAGKLLIEELGIQDEGQLMAEANGKLTAPGFPYFNLSHSGNYVLIATAPFTVGVDIECIKERHVKVAKRVYTETECAWMEHDPLARFHVLWTQKEAVMKLDGRGFSLDPASFEMSPLGCASTTKVDGKRISVSSFRYDDCMASIAIQKTL